MFRRYFKMTEKLSKDLFVEFEARIAPSVKIRDALMDAFIAKWFVHQALVHNGDYEDPKIVGYRVPFEEITPEWATRIEFVEDSKPTAFWKPNTSTEKGKELDDDLQIINNQPVEMFSAYIIANFLGSNNSIGDENGDIHKPMAGRVAGAVLMEVPVACDGGDVGFIKLGFSEVEEGEFIALVAEAQGI